MNIILDTNIYVSDWYLDTLENTILLDYCKSKWVKIMMPEVVWQEIRGKYRTKVEEALREHKKAVKALNRYIMKPGPWLEKDIGLQVDDLVESYMVFLREKLELTQDSFLPLPANLLPTLVHKAIYRMKPFDAAGQQFRDAILWHTLLAKAWKEIDMYDRLIVLISNDASAFGDGRGRLHPDLVKEVQEVKRGTDIRGRVAYYHTMKGFLEENYKPAKHITNEFINEKVDEAKVIEDIREYILNTSGLVVLAVNNHRMPYRYLDSKTKLEVKSFEIVSHWVYTFTTGKIAVMVDVQGTLRHEGKIYRIQIDYNSIEEREAAEQMVHTLDTVNVDLEYRTNLHYWLQADGSIEMEDVKWVTLNRLQ